MKVKVFEVDFSEAGKRHQETVMAESQEKAIETLKKDKKGFILHSIKQSGAQG